MKILHTVQFYEPSQGGMQTVVKQLSERLVRRGHTVTVATSYDKKRTETRINGVSVVPFHLSGNLVQGFTGDLEEYRSYVRTADADIVVNFAAQQWATDALLPILDEITSKKIFVPTGFSALYDKNYHEYFQRMPEWMRQYDMNVFHSTRYRDAEFAARHEVKKILIIPNGAAADEFSGHHNDTIRSQLGIGANALLILLVGSHSGDKGHQEAIRIFENADITNATLLIVGNTFSKGCDRGCARQKFLFSLRADNKRRKKTIRITELIREETIAAYHAADVFLFPSRIECSPIVLFECLAAKLPFLATDVGNVKEIIELSQAGILLPTHTNALGYASVDETGAVPILEKICRSSLLRQTMGERGQAVWKKRFTWEHIARQYESLYETENLRHY